MPIFQVTPLSNNADQIGESVRKHVAGEDCFELQHRAGWLVSFKGTSVELCALLGITSTAKDVKPTLGSAMVTAVGAYYGIAATTMWEWLKNKVENP